MFNEVVGCDVVGIEACVRVCVEFSAVEDCVFGCVVFFGVAVYASGGEFLADAEEICLGGSVSC